MPLPDLESLTPGIFSLCDAILGDTFEYRAVGASEFATIKGLLNFAEAARDISTGQVIEQDMVAKVSRSTVPVRPSQSCRLRSAKLPGKTYKPVNVKFDESAMEWVFELEQTDG